MLKIRSAYPRDAEHITQIHLSDAPSQVVAVTDPYIRWSHGGPWMHPLTARKYIERVTHRGGRIFLAVDKYPIGEADVWESHEWHTRILHISLLWVHLKYRNKGVGSSLMNHILQHANRIGVTRITTWPEESALSFYDKWGFRLHLPQTYVKLRAKNWHLKYERIPFTPRKLPTTFTLLLGKTQCSREHWEIVPWEAKLLNRYKATRFFALRGVVQNLPYYLYLTKWPWDDHYRVYLWVKEKDPIFIPFIQQLAHDNGWHYITTVIPNELLPPNDYIKIKPINLWRRDSSSSPVYH